jgi:hypothetical protein
VRCVGNWQGLRTAARLKPPGRLQPAPKWLVSGLECAWHKAERAPTPTLHLRACKRYGFRRRNACVAKPRLHPPLMRERELKTATQYSWAFSSSVLMGSDTISWKATIAVLPLSFISQGVCCVRHRNGRQARHLATIFFAVVRTRRVINVLVFARVG